MFSRVVITLLLRALADLYELRGVAIPPATMAGITTFLPKIIKIFFFSQFGCSIDAAQQQMALNFELVLSDQLLSVVLAAYK